AVNLLKSAVFFSRNSPAHIKSRVCAVMNGISCHRSTKYLGLPLGIGRSMKEVFSYLVEAVKMKLQGWKSKLLSSA
ncbi:Unknown protein, partial [Striga hermonthica]